jgi:thiol-disulfide isomerase/thioredoxin
MKHFLFSIIAIALVFISCNSDKKINEYTVVAGKITSPKSDFVVLIHNSLINSKLDTIKLDGEGNFHLAFNNVPPQFFRLHHENEYASLFLNPGDSVFVSIHADKFDESIAFTGSGSESNNYLSQRFLLKQKIVPNEYDLYKLEPEAFLIKIDSVGKALTEQLEKCNLTDTHFTRLQKASFDFYRAGQLLHFADYYKYFNQKDTVILPNDFYANIDNLNLNDSSFLLINEFLSYIENKFQQQANNRLKLMKNSPGESDYTLISMEEANRGIKNQKIKDYIFYKFFSDHVTYSGIENILSITELFDKHCSNNEYRELIETSIAKWEAIATGKPAPNFSYPDINGKTISLSDFKGKYVYIDVWATWCGPCKTESPHFESLKKEYEKNSNIVFLSISVDESKEAWEKMVKEKELSDYQLFGGGWASDITKNYLVQSIPRFILIDKQGKIVSANTERPSGKIREVLKKLSDL